MHLTDRIRSEEGIKRPEKECGASHVGGESVKAHDIPAVEVATYLGMLGAQT